MNFIFDIFGVVTNQTGLEQQSRAESAFIWPTSLFVSHWKVENWKSQLLKYQIIIIIIYYLAPSLTSCIWIIMSLMCLLKIEQGENTLEVTKRSFHHSGIYIQMWPPLPLPLPSFMTPKVTFRHKKAFKDRFRKWPSPDQLSTTVCVLLILCTLYNISICVCRKGTEANWWRLVRELTHSSCISPK